MLAITVFILTSLFDNAESLPVKVAVPWQYLHPFRQIVQTDHLLLTFAQAITIHLTQHAIPKISKGLLPPAQQVAY